MMDREKKLRTMIDWMTTLLPLVGVVLLCVVFVMFPEQSVIVLQTVRGFLGDECGIYYAVIGTGNFNVFPVSCIFEIRGNKIGRYQKA